MPRWFVPHFEFRFPRLGAVETERRALELRQALEPWLVLGEQSRPGATTPHGRFLARARAGAGRRRWPAIAIAWPATAIRCRWRPRDASGEAVAGVRFRAWPASEGFHPTIAPHVPLTFDIVDTWTGRSIGGCRYHVAHPGGRNFQALPVNALEAESRRHRPLREHRPFARQAAIEPAGVHPDFPLTLDLRRVPRRLTRAQRDRWRVNARND